jgi:hypothetical protein
MLSKKSLSYIKTAEESIAINILKLETASITAIKQSNILLENQIKTQLPSRSKYQQELPKIIYNNIEDSIDALVEGNHSIEIKNNGIIYND